MPAILTRCHRAAATPSAFARRKPPLTVEALWAMKRIATPTLSPDGAIACAAVTSFDMDRQRQRAPSCGCSRPASAPRATARALTAGDKDSDPQWSPDGALDRVHREAQGRRRAADLPDRARRRRGAAADVARDGLRVAASGLPTASASPSSPGSGRISRPTRSRRSGCKERKDAKVKAHVTERAEYRFWDHWLTDGREPHVFVCDVATGRCRDALAGTGLALPPWDPTADDFDIAPDGREIALTADLARRAADDEPDATSSPSISRRGASAC